MIDKTRFVSDCLEIRQKSPLILNITNHVAMNFNANALLAVGASPVMSSYPAEIKELTSACDALVINIGCLDDRQIKAMMIAADCACEQDKPWVLDPVGVGVSKVRRDICKALITRFHPSVIRGNASEIVELCHCLGFMPSYSSSGRGVDSTVESVDVIEEEKTLALVSGSVVSMSGATDIITDGKAVETVCNGHPLMPRVTAMGCTATALTGAFLSVEPSNPLAAALDAMALMGLCGEIAASKSDGEIGTGSFQIAFLDALSTCSPTALIENIRQ